MLLNINQLLSCLEVNKAPRTGDRFYLCVWKILGMVVEGPSVNRYKEKWFYAFGD